MQKSKLLRILTGIVLFWAVINGWWPIIIIMGIVAAWYWPYYVEGIIAGVAYDALFGMVPGLGYRGYIGTIISIVLYTIILLSKKVVRR